MGCLLRLCTRYPCATDDGQWPAIELETVGEGAGTKSGPPLVDVRCSILHKQRDFVESGGWFDQVWGTVGAICAPIRTNHQNRLSGK